MTKRIDYKKKFEDYKEAIADIYDDRFDDFKQDMAERFSDFVDTILEDELKIPDRVIEYAKKGELYDDLMRQFQIRLGIEQGLIDKEVKDMMKDAKEEILSMRNRINATIGETLEMQKDAQDMAALLYVREELAKNGLASHFLEIFEGRTLSKDVIDKVIQDIRKWISENPGHVVCRSRKSLEKENAELHRILKAMLKV